MKKRSRLLSALLALVMVLGLFPALGTTALAAEQREITQVDLAVAPPEAGKTPGAATVIGDADQYEIWNHWDPPVNVFEAGGTYTVEVHLTAKNGVFSRDVKATMNGQTATVTEGAGTENLTVSYTFQPLPGQASDDTDVVAIIGIDVPVAGAAPDRTAEAESPNHIVTNVQWSPGDSKFVAGKEYTVNVTVKGDGDYRPGPR